MNIKGFTIPKNTILFGPAGSHAYGTNIDTSDYDYKGVFMHTYEERSSFLSVDDVIQQDSPDVTLYELRKFFNLAIKCNPNILELLFLEEDSLILNSSIGKLLVKNRYEFLSKRAFASYAGYATSQLKRLEGYRNNSDTRKELREKFSYDTKFGMHLIRLLRMLNEVLDQRTIIVRRPDAQELLEIRNGALTLEELTAEAEALKNAAEKKLISTTLPDMPDYNWLSKLCANMHFIQDIDYDDRFIEV